jgi:hypothetical protein
MTPEERRKQDELRKEQREEDWRQIMALPAGRRWLWRLLEERCQVWGLSFNVDAALERLSEGRRSIGVELIRECQRLARAEYVRMLTEQLESREAIEPPQTERDE